MYRKRLSNKAISGPYAHLNGKRVTWERNLAPADPTSSWEAQEGKVVCVGENGRYFYVDCAGTRFWINEMGGWQRNIKISD